MKKITWVLILPLLLVMGACKTTDSKPSATNASTTSESKIHEVKELTVADAEKIEIGDAKETVYEALGQPLKEWRSDSDFVQQMLDNEKRKVDMKSTLKKSAEELDKEKNISTIAEENLTNENLILLQYTVNTEMNTQLSSLVWIDSKTDKVSLTTIRSFLNEDGTTPVVQLKETGSDKPSKGINTFNLGDTVIYTDELDGTTFDITVEDISKSRGNSYYKPEGAFFSVVSYTVVNSGDVSASFSPLNFSFYDETGAEIKQYEKRPTRAQTLAPGELYGFSVYYDIPTEEENYDFRLDDAIWKGSYVSELSY
ncbi:hypothetical protein IGI37_003121 [Enterococcus sp. AZ194]|uniref:DUF4352 domain-containing protein n=1 Tax=Enterococcus sp. AZ194 TaxID=2774629 RepID=UPI003F1E7072